MKASQLGAATLGIAVMLTFLMLMGVVFAHRGVVFDARSSVNQYRAAQAHEAAEAGIDWALAQLNSTVRVDSDCRPSGDAQARPFRERPLTSLEARCTASSQGWDCHCTAPLATSVTSTDTAFTVALALDARTGELDVRSRGSSHAHSSELGVRLGRLAGLDALPAAALTVRGSALFGEDGMALHHTNASTGGLNLHSGARVDGPTLHLQGPPGTPAQAAVVSDDAALAELSAAELFASTFRMSPAAWQAQPVALTIDCSHACDDALAQAADTHQLIWLQGGLRLSRSHSLGTPERPLLLVADGPVELGAPLTLHGLLYGRAAPWRDTAGARIHGAVMIETDLHAEGRTQIHHDAAVLEALRRQTGSYARLPGAWRDR